MRKGIEIGSRVNVYFFTAQAEFDVEVLRMPAAAGDSWCLRRHDGTLVEVCLYSKIEERRKEFQP